MIRTASARSAPAPTKWYANAKDNLRVHNCGIEIYEALKEGFGGSKKRSNSWLCVWKHLKTKTRRRIRKMKEIKTVMRSRFQTKWDVAKRYPEAGYIRSIGKFWFLFPNKDDYIKWRATR